VQRGPGGVGCSRTNGRFGEESAVEVHEQSVARRFVLVDEEGNPAAYITGAEAGFVGFQVEGPGEEEPLVSIGFNTGSSLPLIRIRRPEGGQVAISVTEDGTTAVYLEDADGAKRVIST
jgi:hypothetical protein